MKLVILTGPTGTGKTKLSLNLAKALNTEIISADSMQIYKYMDIGTDKISKDEMHGIKHHMLDVVYPDQDFTVEDFRDGASSIIRNLNKNGKIGLVVGGTGLYINSLIYDLNFTVAPPNKDLRAYYENLAHKKGNDFLHNILDRVDPITAEKNHPNQVKRIVRALEVFDYTGKPYSSFETGPKYLNDVEFIYIVLQRDRKDLYNRINLRVDQMLDQGLVDEVKGLLDMGYRQGLVSMEAIGYKEIIKYLNGDWSLDQAVDKVKQHSRNYAKRQLTWFRREKSRTIVDVDEYTNIDDLTETCIKIIGDHYDLYE